MEYMIENKIQLAVLTETWIKHDALDVLARLDVCGFNISLVPRPGDRRGGGIALLYRSGADVVKIEDGILPGFEYASWKIKINSIDTYILGVYHPPYSAVCPVSNQQFTTS